MTVARLRLDALQQAVLECLAYSDVFDYPLTADEVWRRLPYEACRQEVEAALTSAALDELVVATPPYFVLRGREHLAAVRARRAEASRRLFVAARRYGRMIASLPFVRMVAVTGALAAGNSEEDDDIDYLIVTAPGRLWLARTLTMAVVRLAALRGVTLCPNYLIAEDALACPDRDIYTARELLQMRPLCGAEAYRRMLEANAWWRDYLPNLDPDPFQGPPPLASRLLRSLGEPILRGRAGDALEAWCFRRKARELRNRGDGNGEAVFEANVCKGHFDAHRARTQAALAARLARLGVEP